MKISITVLWEKPNNRIIQYVTLMNRSKIRYIVLELNMCCCFWPFKVLLCYPQYQWICSMVRCIWQIMCVSRFHIQTQDLRTLLQLIVLTFRDYYFNSFSNIFSCYGSLFELLQQACRVYLLFITSIGMLFEQAEHWMRSISSVGLFLMQFVTSPA